VRSYADLLSEDPAWPEIEALVTERVTVLARDAARARSCLEALQVTTRSPLGAIAHETGGMLVDHGWLRLLGSGHPQLERALGRWNAELGVPVGDCMIVGDDVVGGVFAIDGGALGFARGNVCYFAPDRLAWEDMGLGYGAFVGWALRGDLALFYENLRWPGWEAEVAQVASDRALSLYPPPWTVEGKDVSKVSRGAVPVGQLFHMQMDVRSQLQ
jgi:hypothetical protein